MPKLEVRNRGVYQEDETLIDYNVLMCFHTAKLLPFFEVCTILNLVTFSQCLVTLIHKPLKIRKLRNLLLTLHRNRTIKALILSSDDWQIEL